MFKPPMLPKQGKNEKKGTKREKRGKKHQGRNENKRRVKRGKNDGKLMEKTGNTEKEANIEGKKRKKLIAVFDYKLG